MRDIINLCEAPRARKSVAQAAPVAPATPVAPAAPTFDTSELTTKLQGLVGVLKRQEDFQFSTELVERIRDTVNAKKVAHDQMVEKDREWSGDEHNPADWSFDPRETFREIAPEMVRRSIRSYAVRAEARDEQADYQHQMMTNHEDLSDFVESSAFLTALSIQRDLGVEIDTQIFRIDDASTWGQLLERIQMILDSISAFNQRDERIAPKWLRCVHEDLCLILPLMMFMLRNKIV